MKQLIKLNEIKPNKDNPRIIKDVKFKKLVKSIKDFPEMLELRPIVVDENLTGTVKSFYTNVFNEPVWIHSKLIKITNSR